MEKFPALLKCVSEMVDAHAHVSELLTEILGNTEKVMHGDDAALTQADLRNLRAAIKLHEVLCMQAEIILAE
ncbi:MAG: hypothetical protein JWP38_3155 [Herbaspirillum sp.]|jgi:hypothetical protein|nr:hypothetical protein [Herbaspirillum sp.]